MCNWLGYAKTFHLDCVMAYLVILRKLQDKFIF